MILFAGRAQAFCAMKLLAEWLEWKHISQVIATRQFVNIQIKDPKNPDVTKSISTVDEYLEHLGFPRAAAFRNLKKARVLTAEEVSLLGQIGLSRKDLFNYASLPDEKRIEIREGKIINLDKANREEIREIIEQILSESRQIKENTEKSLHEKDRVLRDKEQVLNKQAKALANFERKASAREMTPEEDCFCRRMEEYRMRIVGDIIALEPEELSQEFPEMSLRMRSTLISFVHNLQMQINALYDSLVIEIGNPTMNPEVLADLSKWEKENGFQ